MTCPIVTDRPPMPSAAELTLRADALPRLTFSPGDWRAFTARVRAGQLDLG
jgi:hypothetical protein